MMEYLLPILSAWFTMLIILDPLLSVSMFINLTQNLNKAEVIKQAFIATAVAGLLMLSFLFFNNLLQTYDLSLEVFLFLCVALVHHGKAFVIDLARYIVLIGTNEKAVKFTNTLLSLC